ncbi:MAG TPA: NAD-dependent epimerase/dehydratase family protein [Candidatus Limnocylindria bacterium]|jgi:UDP-glucose 4-epimerase|nr:NAD-dependent epimerase/dehydratase family protein [Candidatus Limnocylindria bacterium]
MRVLVTGGAGFIGSTIVDALKARGDHVVVVDDISTGDRANLAPDIALRVADVSDAKALREAVRGESFDAVVHCASRTKVVESMEKPDLYRRVIVEGTRNVVRLAEEGHAQILVNISTGGAIYGETPTCASESVPVDPASNYGKFKAEAEKIVAAARIPNITLRLANVYGPRQRQDLEGGVIAIFLGRWRRGENLTLFGDGTAERDYMYVGDVVDAVLAAFTGKWKGVYNIGTGVATSVNELIVALSEILGPPPGITNAPERPAETQRSCVDATRAKRDGLWQLRTALLDGLRRTASAMVVD